MMTTKKRIISCLLVISLIAIPLVGCTTNQSPIADFIYSPSAPTTADSITFTDTSTDADGTIVTWEWDFGDGNTSTAQNPAHSFTSPGTYTVTLTVTDDGGKSDTYTEDITVSSAPPLIGMWDAIEILVSEIIPPAADDARISAFMLSEPLQNGDVVTSASGGNYPIDINTWFIFIDDAPQAFYAHATRYVFMDARDGSYTIVNESWPPEINGYSMWDAQLGRGHLIEVWSILDIPFPILGSASTAPTGDYGDAPDGQLYVYYGIPGQFPTLYNTTNSHFGRPGGHTLNVGEETLGLNVSAEVDAIDPNDPDGVPNLVDADSDERMYVIMDGNQARLAFTVSVSLGAPDVTRYANALLDFDQSGNWSDGAYGVEWVVVNLEVDVDPGNSETILTPLFPWGNQAQTPWPVCMRVALTREKVDETLFTDVGGWDGSGQFTYGEIEDHFAFLTDNPPPPDGDGDGNGDGNGNGDPPPPGPEKGPCGYDINYYVLIINGGDSADHLGKGTPYLQASANTMAGVASAQGYTSMGNLGPGSNSLADIGVAFDNLAAAVQCGDHVLIYICGHGSESGGIALANSAGSVQELLSPTDLANLLGKIDSCHGEECDTPETCCHVSVIIESCFSGNFNVPGVTGPGRSVTGTSTDTESWATYPGGGIYTQGLDKDLRDTDSDTDFPPDGVDPLEAHASADEAVKNHPLSKKGNQQPWNNPQWCECVCPCSPDIDVEKWVQYYPFEMWLDEIEVPQGQLVTFRLDIESTGTCRDIVDLEIIDFLPDCLEYANEAILYYNGIPYYRPPDISPVVGGLQLTWNLADIGPLAPGEGIAIEYFAYAGYPGANINEVLVSAHCSYDYTNIVTDHDIATVWVYEEEIIAEDVLEGYLEAYYHCECDQFLNCIDCDIDIYFGAVDISVQLGPYPVTSVDLYVNGFWWDGSGSINDPYWDGYTWIVPAECNTTYNLEVVARNSIGLEVHVFGSITTPEFCQQQ